MSKIQMWVPTGTNYTYNSDGSIGIIPPSGWSYVGTDTGGNPINTSASSSSTNISCTCNSGSGCNPFSVEGIGVGCLFGGCTDCSGKASLVAQSIDIESGGYINTSIPPSIITEYNSVPSFFGEMLQVTEVTDLITQYLDDTYQGATIPDFIYDPIKKEITVPTGNVIALVNIAGRAVSLPVPTSAAPGGGSNASCSCSAGSCPLDSSGGTFTPQIYLCEGACTGTCTLSLSTSKAYGQLDLVAVATCYKF